MSIEIFEIIAGAGIGTIISVLVFYFWAKKIIGADIVEPMIAPMKAKIELLENNDKDIKDSLTKINDNLSDLTKGVTKLTAVFDIISNKLEINIKK